MSHSPTSILFVGDLVGGLGRRTLLGLLPGLRERLAPTFVVVNGENVAGGPGHHARSSPTSSSRPASTSSRSATTPTTATRSCPTSTARSAILRPANYLRSQPGHGTCIVERDGVRLGVVNLSGNVFMRAGHPAFPDADACVNELTKAGADQILVDFHAEATSEKVALGWHLDGRVTAVVGTHTHVPTADARVLPGGTAYITDVGMTGPRGGVIGVKREQAIRSLVTQMHVRFDTAEEDPWLNGVLIRCSGPRRAAEIEQLLLPFAASHAGELTGSGSAAGSRPRNAISASGTAQTR